MKGSTYLTKPLSNSTNHPTLPQVKLTLPILLDFLATAFADDTKVVYETSDGSPLLHHVDELIANMKKAPKGENDCNYNNGCGETLTKYSGKNGGVAVMTCGPGMRCSGDPGGMACAGTGCGGIWIVMLPDYIQEIRDKCRNGMRAGGQVVMTSGGEMDRIKLIRVRC